LADLEQAEAHIDEDIVRDAQWIEQWWLPRYCLMRTNFRYRNDALRPRDLRNLDILWNRAEMFLHYLLEWVVYAHGIAAILIRAQRRGCEHLIGRLRVHLDLVLGISRFLYDEGYCTYLSYLELAYYPVTNRNAAYNPQLHFPEAALANVLSMPLIKMIAFVSG
jgi:hypothetical protein